MCIRDSCVGVTEHDKTIPTAGGGGGTGTNIPKLEKLLEYLSHGYITDDLSLIHICFSLHRSSEFLFDLILNYSHPLNCRLEINGNTER